MPVRRRCSFAPRCASSSKIVVAANGREADAKSILSVLGLGATAGTTLLVRADGEDAAAALDALAESLAGVVE